MLGVKPGEVDIGADGNVTINRRGMSVAPCLCAFLPHMVHRRLKPLVPGASGEGNRFVWRMHDGPFATAPITQELHMQVTSSTHGVVRPAVKLTSSEYLAALASTRLDWQIDESFNTDCKRH